MKGPRGAWIAAAAGLAGLAGFMAAAQTAPGPIRILARPVALDPEHPERAAVGDLAYAGGLELSAPGTKAFGGLSGIAVRPDGSFLSQSDAGDLFGGRLVLDARGRLTGIADPTVARLTDESGQPYRGPKRNADAEDITLLPGGGFAVAFEGEHRVLAYGGEGPGRRLAIPPEAKRLPPNTGLEALAAWTDSEGRPRLVEGAEDGRAWSCDPEGRDCQLLLARGDGPGGFRLTGLSALPEGRGLVALYRAADLAHGFRAAIAWVRPGAAPKVVELARLEKPLTVDNMEGIAAVANPDGSVRLYLVSDDNFLFLQRTLLVAFDWSPPPSPEVPRP